MYEQNYLHSPALGVYLATDEWWLNLIEQQISQYQHVFIECVEKIIKKGGCIQCIDTYIEYPSQYNIQKDAGISIWRYQFLYLLMRYNIKDFKIINMNYENEFIIHINEKYSLIMKFVINE